MILAINCTHHTSISCRTEIDSTMSNVPAKIRMASGSLIGMLVGVLGGPVGVLVGWAQAP